LKRDNCTDLNSRPGKRKNWPIRQTGPVLVPLRLKLEKKILHRCGIVTESHTVSTCWRWTARLGERKAKVARLIDRRLTGLRTGQSRVDPGLSLPGSTRLRVESIVKRVPRQGTGEEKAPGEPGQVQ
jgi:hypothetical protein